MTAWLILARAVHIGACLLFFGVFAFDRFTVSGMASGNRKIAEYWKSRLGIISWVLPPVILASGIAWFVLAAVAMSGQPFDMGILKIVWGQTQFGAVSKIRLIFVVAATVLSCFQKSEPEVRRFAAWVQIVAAGCLLGSLAWIGHGQEGPKWHLLADVVHLLAAGIWPAGLLPLLLLLRSGRRIGEPQDWVFISGLVRRFSAISLATVLVLAITGTVNAIFLVGTFHNLIEQPYGRWLLAKIVFFGLALAIAAVNLLRLKPRLIVERIDPDKAAATAGQLERNVQFELVLGSGIVVVVAVLGILPPAIH
ncbi:MAG TPA: CopD family protein [Verrucomicrobiae bacterium]|jgi:putative copper resistance protein D